MKITHDYAARIDNDLWMDCLRVKELDAATTSINSMVNEGLKMVRDRKMQEITAQRKRRNTLQSMVTGSHTPLKTDRVEQSINAIETPNE